MEFKKYGKIKIVGHEDNEGIFSNPSDEIVIQEKLDGCFTYDMKVHTDKGMIPIGRIVNNKLKVKVLSKGKNNKLSYQDISKYYNHGRGENWVRLKYNYFGKERYLTVTKNHNVFTTNGLKQVRDLDLAKDSLITNVVGINDIQEQIIIGSILGDMSFRNMGHKTKNPMFSETHGIKQKTYLKWKKKILDSFVIWDSYHKSRYDINSPVTEKYRISSRSTSSLKRFNFIYKNGKKKIPKNIDKYLTPLSIAVWYMDDGSCNFSNKQRSRATFHTQSFSKKEVSHLVLALKGMGIYCTQHNYKGWQIDVSADGTEKLFKLISPYMVRSMSYKMDKPYRKLPRRKLEVKDILEDCKIMSIEETSPKNSQRYDLEVTKNHNYFIKGISVHNSNFRFMIRDGNIIFGSRSQQLTSDEGEDTNIQKNFLRAVNFVRDKLLLGSRAGEIKKYEGYIFYAECMVKHTMSYDWDRIPPLLGFDIYDIEKERYLKTDIAKAVFEGLGLSFVPIIKIITAGELKDINEEMIPISEYSLHQAEGIVFKNNDKQLMAKLVREKFKEKNRETFGGGKKYAKTDEEYLVAVYCTNARIDKTIFKLMDDGEKLDMTMMSKLPTRVYKDIWEENWQEITNMKGKVVSFQSFKKKVTGRCLLVLKQVIVNNALNNEGTQNV